MRDSARSVRFTRLPGLWAAGALAAFGMLLSGCEVTETTQTYHSGPMCPQIYAPVCAERRGDERTYPNSCEARAAGWRIVADGQCRADYYRDYRDRDYRDRDYRDRDYRDRDYRDRDDRRGSDRDRRNQPRSNDGRYAPPVAPVPPSTPVRPTPPVRQTPPVQPVAPGGACPQVYEQVCGQIGDNTQMFMNRCELLRAGAAEVSAGLCMGGNR